MKLARDLPEFYQETKPEKLEVGARGYGGGAARNMLCGCAVPARRWDHVYCSARAPEKSRVQAQERTQEKNINSLLGAMINNRYL